MKKIFFPVVLALVFLLSVITVSAADIELTHQVIADTIPYNGTAQFTLSVYNNQATVDQINVRAANPLWGEIVFDRYIVSVQKGLPEQVTVRITPPKDIGIGVYDIEIWGSSIANPDIRTTDHLRIHVTTEAPRIEPTFDVQNTLLPGENKVTLILKNRGVAGVSDLTGKISSDALTDDYVFDIGSLSAGQTKLVFDQDVIVADRAFGKYPFNFTLYQNNAAVYTVGKQVDVLEKENLDINETRKDTYFGVSGNVKITNNGNTEITRDYSVTFTGLIRFFVTGNPQPSSIESVNGAKILKWTYTIAPGESFSLYYNASFMPVFIFIIVTGIVIYLLLFYFRAQITVTKKVTAAHGDKSIRVSIHIKNNHRYPIQNVVLTDKIHSPLKLAKGFGTVTPSAIRSENKEAHLTWKLGELEALEERVITYNIKSGLKVIATIMLPECYVKGKVKGQQMTFVSNKVAIKGRIDISEGDEYSPSD